LLVVGSPKREKGAENRDRHNTKQAKTKQNGERVDALIISSKAEKRKKENEN